MSDYRTVSHDSYVSSDRQNLTNALFPNNPPNNMNPGSVHSNSDPASTPQHASSGSFSMSPAGLYDASQLAHSISGLEDDSPFVTFFPDLEFDVPGAERLIGDIPDLSAVPEESEHGEKRKDMDGEDNANGESGRKRRESDDKVVKKPGRKPLMSEPTSKRKAQNRAAQRAFRERKEKHLKDLENKVEELQKASEAANQENGLLRAQVERLQIELREYRKRLSWLANSNGYSPVPALPAAYSRGAYGIPNNELLFDFPKFGEAPHGLPFNNHQTIRANENQQRDAPGVLSRNAFSKKGADGSAGGHGPYENSAASARLTHGSPNTTHDHHLANRNGSMNGFTTSTTGMFSNAKPTSSTQNSSNSNSPSSSSDSHRSQLISSNGTSPVPSLNSPSVIKPGERTKEADNTGTGVSIDGEASFCEQLGLACGNINNPIPAAPSKISNMYHAEQSAIQSSFDFDWLAQQNGGQFDPLLFGNWREPQDAILSQEIGTFFNDALPQPDLGTPLLNFKESKDHAPPKKDLVAQIDLKLEDDEEVVPGKDKASMLTCTKIWDRLQSMDKFRNGEIDVDHLCSELRTKARCSESGAVVHEKDVNDIMARVK